jgi:hypothetical protein
MRGSWQQLRRVAVPVVAAAMCLRLLGDVGVQAAPAKIAFAGAMPATVVWAWEEPEDLRGADAARVGVAYLAETLLLGDGVTVRPRHQPLRVAEGAAVMAVVRMQALPGFRDTAQMRAATAAALAEVARRPGLRVLQVDFDATRSQREFYAGVLEALRAEMPVGMPLSMTALASWCAAGPGDRADWMAGLPVDEAVPMDFRLGGRAKAYGDKSSLTVREPLCRGSVGVSTDESWPEMDVGQARRVYVFSATPWAGEQLAAVAGMDEAVRPAALRVRDDAAHGGRGINDTGLPRQAERVEAMQ